jgi:hypothetical protein
MFIVKLLKVLFIIFVFLAAFLPIYVNVSAFAVIEPDEDDDYTILLDESRLDIRPDGSYVTSTHMKYKILKEGAIDSLGEEKIPYLSETEDVRIIKAVVIKPDGRKVRAKKIHDVSPYSGYAMYTDLKAKIISMRDLAVGDTLDFEYEIEARHSRMPGEVWGGFLFYDDAPIEVSRFTLTAPVDKEINIKAENLEPEMGPVITYSDDNATRTYTWERKDCAKIEKERMMPAKEDLFPYIAYTTIDSWQDIALWFWEKTKDKIEPTPEIIKEAQRITSSSEDTKGRIKDLLAYFRDNIRYVSMGFGLNAFEPHPASEVLENKYGDCKDQTVLLISMLKSLGIDAYPALVRYGQQNRSIDRVAPSPGEFKHAIAYANVNGEDLWLDPLEEGLDLGEIPYSLTEERLLVVRPDGGEFIDIPGMPLDKITSVTKRTIFLGPDGSAIGIFEIMPNSIDSPGMRATIEDYTARDMRMLKTALLNAVAPGGEMLDFYLTDPRDYARPYAMMLKFGAYDWAPPMGDFMILPSLSPKADNPFGLPVDDRNYPIKNTAVTRKKDIIIVSIPDGFRFEYIPENYEKSLPIYRQTLTSQAHNGRLVMYFEMTWFPGEIPVEDYPAVQAFFNDLKREANKVIIIKRERK